MAFILMILGQWYVPGKMIRDRERILSQGTVHRFRTAPVDPVDIFRGKYIDLNFEGNMVPVEDAHEWEQGEEVYGLLSEDTAGFTVIHSLQKVAPKSQEEYLKLTVNYVPDYGRNEIQVNFPFERLYMEESKAYQAELSYLKSHQDDSTSTAYALVSILEGEAVIRDVMIDDVPIREVAQKALENTDP